MSYWQRFVNWLERLLKPDEYEVTIWFVVETTVGATHKTIARSKKVFRMQSIDKINQKQFVGVSIHGDRVQIKTTEPFDYQIVKLS
jgi:hypothetical protein